MDLRAFSRIDQNPPDVSSFVTGYARRGDVAVFSYRTSGATPAGPAVASGWQTLGINKELSDANSLVSLSTNTFTFATGKWEIEGKFTVGKIANNNLNYSVRLRNVTASSVVSGVAQMGGRFLNSASPFRFVSPDLGLAGVFTVTSSAVQYRVQSFGTATTLAATGVANQVQDWAFVKFRRYDL